MVVVLTALIMLASDDGTSGDAESEFSVYSSSSIAKSVAKVRVKKKG